MSHPLTLAQAETVCREFVAVHDTPNVRRAITLAEAGTISWFDLYSIASAALAKAIAEVQS
jgi:hypothetical protein